MAVTRPRVLLVDDEADFIEALAFYLERRRYDVATAASGDACLAVAAEFRPDVVVLDLRLGREDGLAVADRMRRELPAEIAPGLLFLTGRASPVDRIIGLELGADDFLEKPASPREVLARIRAVLRRLGRPDGGRFVPLGGVAVDLDTQSVVDTAGEEAPLGPGEFALLKAFLDAPGAVLSRDELLDKAPASDKDATDRSIDIRILRLRRKLETDDGAPLIETVRGSGYRLAEWASRRLD